MEKETVAAAGRLIATAAYLNHGIISDDRATLLADSVAAISYLSSTCETLDLPVFDLDGLGPDR